MRKCPLELQKYIFEREGVSPDIDPRNRLVSTAKLLVGVTEVGSDNRGKLVELFQSSVSRPLAQSWCLDFVQACISYVELFCVPSPLPSTESVMNLWEVSNVSRGTKFPVPGDIICWQMGTGNHGHCGILFGHDNDRWLTIEGNTSPSSEIDRNGNGVYLKRRLKGGSVTFRELGFIKPWD